ncbi:MAG: hypothetical protein EP338_00120 [Bacteroidetes bacterium]|nr:MAG: hypothetical protein EP338_00120 [Bacteroidota bacterium]
MSLKISFKLKSIKGQRSSVLMMLNFGYKEYHPLKNSYSYKPLKYATGVSIDLNDWNTSNMFPISQDKKTLLRNLEMTARKVYDYLLLENREITPQLLKEEIDLKIKGEQRVVQRIRIVDFIEQVILTGNERGPGTLRNYRKTANKLIDFEKELGKELFVDDVNEDVWLKFKQHLEKRLNKSNSVWDILKNVKATLNEIARKHKDISVFKPSQELSKANKISLKTEEKVFLNFEQIQSIIDYEVKNERLQNVKGILLTLLFTGCRYSDVFKIVPKYEYNKAGIHFRYARFVSEKSNADIIVPILKPLEDFYASNEDLPYPITDVKFNKYVKELCEQIGLDEEITLSYTNSKGRKVYESKRFYEFVSSHIGRRSFITNFINYIPVTVLSKLTGHSLLDKSVIFRYNKISLEENAVLFIKEVIRQSESNPDDFCIRLI